MPVACRGVVVLVNVVRAVKLALRKLLNLGGARFFESHSLRQNLFSDLQPIELFRGQRNLA